MKKLIRKQDSHHRSGLNYFLLLLLVLGLLWGGVIWINRQAEQRGLEEMRRETAALALLFATHADNTFRTVDQALKELREFAGSPPKEIARVMSPYRELLSNSILQTGIIDAQGMVTYSTPVTTSEPIYAGDREFFTVHENSNQDTLFVGRPVKGRLSGKWSVHFSRPILTNGKFSGVVFIAVNPDYFVNFYQSAGLGVGGAARMIRDTGEIMARSSKQDEFIGKVINPSPYADPGAPIHGSFRRLAQVDGVDRLSSYSRLPEYGVTVVIGPSVDERLAGLRDQQHRLLLAAGVISLLTMLVVFLLWQRRLQANKAQQLIEKSEQRFRSLFVSMSEGVALHQLVKDSDGQVVNYQYIDVNPAFELQTGLNSEAVAGKLATEVLQVETPPFLKIYAEVVRSGQPAKFEMRFEPKNKDFIIMVFSPEPEQFAIIVSDITERKHLQALKDADHQKLAEQYQEIIKLQEQLQHQASHDAVTQLHNRRFLTAFLPGEFARAKREGDTLSFIMLDLDHFKLVNDNYGHAVGDTVLVRVANILKANARANDLVCRFGGEEFLMVMSRMTSEQAYHRVDTIRQMIADSTIELADITIRVTVSAGVASYPVHGSSPDVLIKRADDALYRAKNEGRNRVVIAADDTREDGVSTSS